MRQSTREEALRKEALLRGGIEVSQLEAKLDLEPQTDPRSRGVIVRQNCQALALQFKVKAQPQPGTLQLHRKDIYSAYS